MRPWHEYTEGLRYMRSAPLILAIALVGIGWATGGGAAQILFSCSARWCSIAARRVSASIWGCAGVGSDRRRRRRAHRSGRAL